MRTTLAKRTRKRKTLDPIINPFHLAFIFNHEICILDPLNGRNRITFKIAHSVIWIRPLKCGRLVANCLDRVVRIWELKNDQKTITLQECAELKENTKCKPLELADGRLVFRSRSVVHVIIWNFITGKVVKCNGHSARIQTVIALMDGRHIATSSADATVRIWEIETGRQIAQQIDIVTADMIQLHDGRLALCSITGRLHIWKFWEPMTCDTSVGFGYFSTAKLKQLQTGQLTLNSYVMHLINVDQPKHKITKFEYDYRDVIELDNGWWVGLGGRERGFAYLINPKAKFRRQLPHEYYVTCVAKISHQRFVSATRDGIYVWDANDFDAPPLILNTPFATWKIQELPDGRLLARSARSYITAFDTPHHQFCIVDIETNTCQLFNGKCVHLIHTPNDRQTCQTNVRELFQAKLNRDVCDVVADFVAPSAKRQRTL